MESILKHLGALQPEVMVIFASILLAGLAGYFGWARPKLTHAWRELEKFAALVAALLAKHMGASKTIVRVARSEYIDLMEKVGVDIVLSSRLLSASEVMAFARRGGVVSVSLLEGAKAEAVEVIRDGSHRGAHDGLVE